MLPVLEAKVNAVMMVLVLLPGYLLVAVKLAICSSESVAKLKFGATRKKKSAAKLGAAVSLDLW